MRKAPDFSRLRITVATSVALLATGCGRSDVADQPVRYCTDLSGRRIDDANCDHPSYWGGAHYYYVGRGAHIPAIGQPAFGGSNQAAAGVRYTTPEGVTRGGFGRIGAFFGSRGG